MSGKEKVQIEVEVSSNQLNVKHATCPKGHVLCCDESVKIHNHPAIKVKVRYKEKEGRWEVISINKSPNRRFGLVLTEADALAQLQE